MSSGNAAALGNNRSNSRKSNVAIHSFGVCEAMNPLEWPSGDFLKSILEIQCESKCNSITSGSSSQCAHISDAQYWQAAARHALLRKFRHQGIPELAATNSAPYQWNEIQAVQQHWDEAVKEILRKENLNAPNAVTYTIVGKDNGVGNVTLEHGDNNSCNSECRESAASISIDLIEFVLNQCCISNNRQLEWSVMSCPPGVQFQLHAHPNIELIYCIRGTLYEVRMNGPPITRHFEDREADANGKLISKVVGPKLTYMQRSWSFGTLKASQWLVNEVGSIHKSFTSSRSDGGCDLLVLWGGSHANILDPPNTPNIQKAVDSMDERLKEDCNRENSSAFCCYDINGNTISESFLPESEKSATI